MLHRLLLRPATVAANDRGAGRFCRAFSARI